MITTLETRNLFRTLPPYWSMFEPRATSLDVFESISRKFQDPPNHGPSPTSWYHVHQEVFDRRLMHQSTPCVDQRQKAMKYEPFVNQRRLKTRSTTHFRCKTTHSKTTGLKNAYNSVY